MKAIVQRQAGEPHSTMELRSVPDPSAPKPGHVIVAIDLASVHHGDLFFARRAKELPDNAAFFTTGTEAVGHITQISHEPAYAGHFSVGDRVAVFLASGTWAEQIEVPVINVCKVPTDVPDTIAAQLFVNSITALMVLRALEAAVPRGRLTEGAILLTGASTAVAKILAFLMLEDGYTMAGLTRSQDSAERMTGLLPEIPYIATANDGWSDAVSASVGERPIVAVADCVSGAFLAQISPLIDDDACIITYGGLDNGPLALTGLEVTSRQLMLRGVTVGRWLTELTSKQQEADLATTIALTRSHPEFFTTGGTFGIDDWQEAISAVEAPGRDGLVLLKVQGS